SVFSFLGLTAGGIIGSIITATVGAIILLFVINLIKKA
ncbi:GlsB/YeaQ/YmgE family stress response membrane protein, partial [Psychromonas sp.]